jgi:hypothetical protein
MRGVLISRAKLGPMTLEERVLRVLYEAAISQGDCAAELYGRVLDDLAAHGYALVVAARFTLTPLGSERLADLVEARERSQEVA